MDIFQFASYANIFTSNLVICFIVGGLCFAIVYIFQGVGLYTIATKAGYGRRWMAWVPFLQTYYIGVCAQKNKVFNMDSRHFAIAVLILDILMLVGYILYYTSYFLVRGYIYYVDVESGYYIFSELAFYDSMPTSLNWAAWIYKYFGTYILGWLEIIFVVAKLFLFTAFYRTYSSARYMLFSIVGALTPLNGIIIYIIRNNKGLNYNDYLRRVREENYRRYQQQQNMYNQNPYNQNPYSRGYGAPPPPQNNEGNETARGGTSAADDPFGEYGDGNSDSKGNEDPFDEFN